MGRVLEFQPTMPATEWTRVPMARCDEGYLCDVCGREVETIIESDLYLRYVIGEVAADQLQAAPERHIRCNPAQAQFIVDPEFPPVTVEGPFDKRVLDPDDVRRFEELLTRGWRRLKDIARSDIPLDEYPLEEVRHR